MLEQITGVSRVTVGADKGTQLEGLRCRVPAPGLARFSRACLECESMLLSDPVSDLPRPNGL
jgi:hypothetical protein